MDRCWTSFARRGARGRRCTTTWTPCWPTEDIDILSIATSDHTHANLGITAIVAGVPMVFCEKPMTTSLADADALVAGRGGRGDGL